MDKFECHTKKTVGVRFQKCFSKRMKMRYQSFKKIQRKLTREENKEEITIWNSVGEKENWNKKAVSWK